MGGKKRKQEKQDAEPQEREEGPGRQRAEGQEAGGQPKTGPGRGTTSKPSAVQMLKPKSGRLTTVSVALPASIVENAQGGELKAVLVGQIARALTIYGVDEVVIFEDRTDAVESEEDGVSNSMAFFARNLQYLETPQYLRKQLVPHHKDLKWVGLLAPLDAPHHLRKYENLPYREGVVLKKQMNRPQTNGDEGEQKGCWVNCGLEDPVWVAGSEIATDVRVTVRLDEELSSRGRGRGRGRGGGRGGAARQGRAVDPQEPREQLGLYWGFQTRLAGSLKAVFDESPWEGGYDLSIGTSERGESLGLGRLPKFRHLLLAFGGLGGFEEVLADAKSGYKADTDPVSLFSRYVNVCPRQKSRTIRTEEALLITLAILDPLIAEK
ncbi:SPOUT1 [Symbiodinium necroappetens]|uniref:SPOUT1 protein n=1 Tax=Symbiodinium necroappetens TaxID=1628268 RepID=A0A812K6S7_9DINO|nr:SPOUT1 [Symbiodinium necroappetens]